MKILFAIRFFPVYGGGETVTICLANKLVSLGHEVHIFYLWDRGECDYDNRIYLHKVKGIHMPYKGEKVHLKDWDIIFDQLKKYVADNGIEYIINQWLDPKVVYQASNGLAKVVSCRHAAVYINSRKWNAVKKILGRKIFKYALARYYMPYLKYSDRFVLLCNEYVAEMNEILGEKYRGKIVSIHNPCRYQISINRPLIKENMVCYVGRLYPEKQVDIIIRAWKNIEEKVLRNGWTLYIIGSGPSERELKEIVQKYKCKNIRFEGYKEPSEYLKRSKIFLSASATEGYPMTVVEAMAFKVVPIIANTYSAVNGILGDNDNGIKIDVVTAEEFSKNMEILINDEKLLNRMSNNCVSFCSKHYDINRIIAEWVNLLKKI